MKKISKIVLFACTVSLGLIFASCNKQDKENTSTMEDHQHSQNDNMYACPMHPQVQGEKGDKCSKCGMDLVKISKANSAEVDVELRTEPQNIEAGTPAKLAFEFKQNNKNVALDISHEMRMHLMLVDEKLMWFRHIHPEEQAKGSYLISETFPHAGKYYLFSDIKPQGMASFVGKKEIIVTGDPVKNEADFSSKLISMVDGYTVTLENGDNFKTNRTQSLEISVEKDGKKLSESDIEPYRFAATRRQGFSPLNFLRRTELQI